MRRSIPLLLIALLLSACGGDKAATEDSDPAAAEPFPLEVIAGDFSFDLGEETVPTGPLEIRLENVGSEPHQALIYRLNDGVEYEDYLRSVMDDDSRFPALSVRTGGINYGISPGEAEVHEESDPYEPGSYAVVCFIRETESGKNHYELGMIAPFTVR